MQPISSLYFRVENTMRQMEMATSSLKTETTIALSQSMDSVNTNPEEEVSACQLFVFQPPHPSPSSKFCAPASFPPPPNKKQKNTDASSLPIPPQKMRSKRPPSYCQFHQPDPSLSTPPPQKKMSFIHTSILYNYSPSMRKGWGYCIPYL